MRIWKLETAQDLAYDGLTSVEYLFDRKIISSGNKSFWLDTELKEFIEYVNQLEKDCDEAHQLLQSLELQRSMRDSSLYGGR